MKKTKRILSLDIGTSTLKMAVLDISGAKINLLKTGLKEFPEAGVEKNKEFIKTSIKEFLGGDISPRMVYLTLCGPYVQIERVELPDMPQKEVPEAVKWKIKDKISFSLDEAVIDSIVTGSFVNEDGIKQLNIMSAIAKKKEIYDIISIFQELRLQVVSINAVSFGLGNILGHIEDIAPEESVAIAEIGAHHTSVSIYKRDKLMFTRNIPISSSRITDSMCGVLVSDKGRVELATREAEDIKRQFGLPLDRTDMLNDKISAVHIVGLIRPILENMSSEIKRTFTYYESQLKGSMPARIYLAGGGARLKNLKKFLGAGLNMNAEYLELPKEIINESKSDKEEILPFLGLIGAVLQIAERKVNLLPPELMTEKIETIQKVSIRMAGLTAFSILVLLYATASMYVSSYKRRLEGVKSHRDMLQKVMDLYNEVSEWNDAVSVIRKGEMSGELLLKEISNIIPDNIMLNSLSIDLINKTVILNGVLYPRSNVIEDEITRFMERIEASSFFRQANLEGAQKGETGGRPSADFEISCIIR